MTVKATRSERSRSASPKARGRSEALRVVGLLSGGVFVVFGLGKFIDYGSEVASFKSYGLPAPWVFVVGIGVIEVVGGMLLIADRLVRAVAIVLAVDMVGAIAVSGIAKGELISLTLAPALLIAMVSLVLACGRGTRVHRHRVLGSVI